MSNVFTKYFDCATVQNVCDSILNLVWHTYFLYCTSFSDLQLGCIYLWRLKIGLESLNVTLLLFLLLLLLLPFNKCSIFFAVSVHSQNTKKNNNKMTKIYWILVKLVRPSSSRLRRWIFECWKKSVTQMWAKAIFYCIRTCHLYRTYSTVYGVCVFLALQKVKIYSEICKKEKNRKKKFMHAKGHVQCTYWNSENYAKS